MGIETPDAGQITIGQTVKIGYYAQMIGEDMNPNQKVIDYVKDVAEYIETDEGKITAARMLERFLFEGEDQYGLIGKLSGGERRRLNLLRVLMDNPNVLILDEPTNDLDISTLTILEDYLDHFQGIVIVVSHDRYFMDRVVRRVFAFEEGGRLRQFEGGYTDYSASLIMEEMGVTAGDGNSKSVAGVTAQTKTGANWKEGQQKKLKFTYAEQKEYDTIEADIAALEEKIEKLEKDIVTNARDFVKLAALHKEKEETEMKLEQKMDRWMYLEDLAARIEKGEMV